MRIAFYTRVSKDDGSQTTDHQINALKNYVKDVVLKLDDEWEEVDDAEDNMDQ